MDDIIDTVWKKRNSTQKILTVIALVLLLILFGYLIWRIVYERKHPGGGGGGKPGRTTTQMPDGGGGGGGGIDGPIDGQTQGTVPDGGDGQHTDNPDDYKIEELQKKYTRHRFPYVAIIRQKGHSRSIKCLGVVIRNDNVLTLASCIQDYKHNEYEVVVAKYYLARTEPQEVAYDVKKVEFHPFFKRKPKIHNLALIETEKIFPYGKHVCRVYLNYEHSVAGTAVVHGWRDHSGHNNPMKTTTFLLTDDYCEDGSKPICKGTIKPKFNKYCVGMLGSPIVQEMYPRQVLLGLSLTDGYPCAKSFKSPQMLKIDAHSFPFDLPR